MKFSSSIIALIASTVTADVNTPLRVPVIVGGIAVSSINTYPWVASVEISGSHSCGGSLIAPNILLTAGHCSIGSASSRKVAVFRYDRKKTRDQEGSIFYDVKQIIQPPNYNGRPVPQNDISIWVLQMTSNPQNRTAVTVRYASSEEQPVFPSVVRAIGWGTTSSGGPLATTLLQVDVPLVDNVECQKNYQNDYPNMVAANTFCAAETVGGKDTCQGDSGGPVFQTVDGVTTVYGVTSWGKGCALKGFPGVYARVGSHKAFIDAQLAKYAIY